MKKIINKEEMLRNEIRQGNFIYTKDVFREYYKGTKKRKEGWVFRHLDAYWFQAILNLGADFFEPIPLTDQIMERFEEYFEEKEDGTLAIPGTKIVLIKNEDVWTFEVIGEKMFPCKYVHQLQNHYLSFTGVKIDSYIKDLCPMIPIDY